MANPTISTNAATPSSLRKWVGVVPFFLFAILFLILPSLRLFAGSFTNNAGQFTFDNILLLFKTPSILSAYWLSIRISAVTAIGGGIFGFCWRIQSRWGLPSNSAQC
jgi:putative spermidine/putrescine transport system permease protein